MDGTLTESREEIQLDMVEALKCLKKKYRVAVISGSTKEQMAKQMPQVVKWKEIHLMYQSGSHTELNGKEFWKETMKVEHQLAVLNHLQGISPRFLSLDLVQIRGGQISFSIIGHDADLEMKKAFDPVGEFRRWFLERYPLKLKAIEARIGGTTCIDYTPRGKNKAYFVRRLAKRVGIHTSEILYIGDALFKGGNDETVLDVCKTIPVRNPEETLHIIERLCA